ncbi:hypothetical protein ACTXT7_009494 [Hymenolepis weldensis]
MPHTTTLVQAAIDDMKLYPSVRDSVKVANFTHSIESSMPKVVHPACLRANRAQLAIIHQDQVSEMSWSVPPKRLTMADDKCKQPEETGLAKSASLTDETVSRVVI